MRSGILSLGWWRGLCAALFLLGLLAPPEAMANTSPLPDWLAAAFCHAPGGDRSPGHGQDGTLHEHCPLCLVGHALASPPAAPALPLPRLAASEHISSPLLLWPGPGADQPYASRAPPRIG